MASKIQSIIFRNGKKSVVPKSRLSKTKTNKLVYYWSLDPENDLSSNFFDRKNLPIFETDPESELQGGYYYCELVERKKCAISRTVSKNVIKARKSIINKVANTNNTDLILSKTNSIAETEPISDTASQSAISSNEKDWKQLFEHQKQAAKTWKKSYEELKQRYNAVVDENEKLTRVLKNGILGLSLFERMMISSTHSMI